MFKDDVQVKLLFASLHRGRGGNKAGRISLVARTRTSAIEDMQLAGQLLEDDDELGDTEAAPTVAIENDYDHFAPGVAARLRQLDKFEHQAFVLGSNDRLIQHVLFQSARWLLTGVDTAINRMERLGGGLPRVEDIVNEMAEQNAVDRDLLWSTVRIELPALPLLPGDSERFKEGVRDAFRRFADERPNLSPVLVPLRVTVLVIPPVRPLAGAKDLDNILITVMKIVQSELRSGPIDAYQVIEVHRQPDDADQGAVILIPGLGWNQKSIWAEAEDFVERKLAAALGS